MNKGERPLFDTIESFFWIFGLLFRKPSLLFLCLKPWGVGLATWGGLFWLSLYTKGAIDAQLAVFVPDQLFSIADAIVIPLLLLITGLIALVVALITNEYMIDVFIERTIAEATLQNAIQITPRSALQQTFDGVLRLCMTIFLTIVCFVIGIFPLLALVSLVFSSFIFGYAIYDCPLCIRGMNFRARCRYMIDNYAEVFWLGGLFSLTFLVPGLSLLLLPIGYGAAAKLMIDREIK